MRHFHSIITGAVCALILGASLPSCVSKAEYESQYEELEGRVAKLETMCSRMQNNLNFMTVMMIAASRGEYITAFTELTDTAGRVDGYVVTFSQSGTITVYSHSSNMLPGFQAGNDGVYYWTINGDLVTDSEGNNIPVSAMTPQLKVVDELWYVSFDNGRTWKVLTTKVDGLISNVKGENNTITFTLADGSNFTFTQTIDVFFAPDHTIIFSPGENKFTFEANPAAYIKNMWGYTNSSYNARATVIEAPGVKVKYIRSDEGGLRLELNIPEDAPDYFSIRVDVYDDRYNVGEHEILYQSELLYFEKVKTDYQNTPGITYVTSEAQPIYIDITTNSDTYEICGMDDYDWLHPVPGTKAHSQRRRLDAQIDANTGEEPRIAKLTIETTTNPKTVLRTYVIMQVGTKEIIEFKDAEVKRLLLENSKADSNKDGEISYLEAVQLESMRAVFPNSSIKEFPEFKYFLNIGTREGHIYFSGCSSLTNIELPASTKGLWLSAFENCVSLKSIILPEGITSIYDKAFKNTGIENIVLPSTLTSLGKESFAICQSLERIETADNKPLNVDIPKGMCQDCANLKYIGFINAETIGDFAFQNCDLSDSPQVTASVSYGDYAFYKTNIRSNTRNAGSGEPSVMNIKCDSIGAHCFEDCENLVPAVYEIQFGFPKLGKDAFKMSSGRKIFSGKTTLTKDYEYKLQDAGWFDYFEIINYTVYTTVVIVMG